MILIDSIVELASRLVATPSCAGIDPPQPVLALVRSLARRERSRAAPARRSDGQAGGGAGRDRRCRSRPRALPRRLHRYRAGRRSRPVERAALPRRGARWPAASAAAPPIPRRASPSSPHVARHFAQNGLPRGALHVLFDADEHTGRFGGVRAYLDAVGRPPDAASLGYPAMPASLPAAAASCAPGCASPAWPRIRAMRAPRRQCAHQGCRLRAQAGRTGLSRRAPMPPSRSDQPRR